MTDNEGSPPPISPLLIASAEVGELTWHLPTRLREHLEANPPLKGQVPFEQWAVDMIRHTLEGMVVMQTSIPASELPRVMVNFSTALLHFWDREANNMAALKEAAEILDGASPDEDRPNPEVGE